MRVVLFAFLRSSFAIRSLSLLVLRVGVDIRAVSGCEGSCDCPRSCLACRPLGCCTVHHCAVQL
eukprot:14823302-Alexandrium_andersonii.AAC.1